MKCASNFFNLIHICFMLYIVRFYVSYLLYVLCLLYNIIIIFIQFELFYLFFCLNLRGEILCKAFFQLDGIIPHTLVKIRVF